ncbi:DUF192 domain-containing protein [Aureisphaera galaxeae]|uniref:DUF192 domain-containing protein n=1 Tax=Aureisphaera galaxeae TaxID=1538023 RepID=UPI00234FBB01|nr:DUF192 domain-containing protein [Aureisphaera galaxeae]MDC8005489.1 DUF192 domain-containing protein [Aureisphaera galaxeae]
MKRRWIAAILVGMLLQSYSCKDNKEKKVLTREVTFKKEGALTLMKKETDSVLAQLDIEIAESDYETQIGLMYRKSMQDDRGMLFIFKKEEPKYFYMKNTEFSIDIIYLNSKKEVVSIAKNAKPFDNTSLPSEGPAQYVLEVNAGLSDRWGLEAGDKFDYTRDPN